MAEPIREGSCGRRGDSLRSSMPEVLTHLSANARYRYGAGGVKVKCAFTCTDSHAL